MSTVTPKVKVAPHSKESEMMVLGCMLTSFDSLNVGADGLDDSDFYFSEHKLVFKVLKAAYRQDKPADIHLVCEELRRQGNLESAGGVVYVTTLAQYAGTSAYIEQYVEIVRSKSILRRMAQAAQLVEKRSLEEPDDVFEELDNAQQLFFKIGQSANPSRGVTVEELLQGVKSSSGQSFLKELEEKQEEFQARGEDEAGITGLSSHFRDVDEMLNGLGESNLIIIAGRPAMGKTVLALNIGANVCYKSKIPVGVFSLEMSAEQLLHRVISSQAEVDAEKIQKGSLDGMEFQRVVAAVNSMQETPMIIDDQPGLKITDLRARARRMKETHNIGLLIVDYLQLLSGSGSNRSQESRQNEISEISRMLKNLARELNVPVLVASQLSRKVEERAGHRPMLSDLRESGSIEQDADVVALLFRRSYYDAMDKPGTAEIIVAKNRHGSVGNIHMAFRPEIVSFGDLSPLDIGEDD